MKMEIAHTLHRIKIILLREILKNDAQQFQLTYVMAN